MKSSFGDGIREVIVQPLIKELDNQWIGQSKMAILAVPNNVYNLDPKFVITLKKALQMVVNYGLDHVHYFQQIIKTTFLYQIMNVLLNHLIV